MELIQATPALSAYTAESEAVDHGHPLVRSTAAGLRAESGDAYAYAEAAYVHIRDRIAHSADIGEQRVTWRASDVLEQGHGICHAKSHALAALLRAEGIPTALCYQRLTEDDGSAPLVHGLVAVRLPGRARWDRQDARGNIPGIDARFSLDAEQLAWRVREELGEADCPVLFDAPHPEVLAALRAAPDRQTLWRTLPTDF
ncbi:transglutaminase-like domain-containing protein [Streptomyces sp. t39]|uniref:transglutaminase-like domain-containing protein n=1 Tax=Streptomyces sp. t39 TaxID=1828156 RepID=UPI0011CDBE98|nr:transglutaminase family protein [Streptomyces sp. t39]TXS44579.1 transglutaminase family protein [Streptomyces sp. t39]